MAPKIAILGIRGIPSNFPGSSGIDTYIEQLLPFLPQKQLVLYPRSWIKKSTCSLIKDNQIISVLCIHHKYLDTGIYTFFCTLQAIFHQDNIFWYHTPGSCLLIKLAKIFNKKTILTIHGIEWQRQKWNTPFNRFFLKSLESMAVHNSDICTAVSQDLCQYIQKTYHKNCTLTPASLVIQKPIPLKLISLNSPYIFYLGRLVPEKKIDLLIKVFLNTPSINQKHKLVISGLIEKNKYCRHLVKLASQNSNIILTSFITGQAKLELLSNCSLFVLPSSLEGNSLSLNEALGLNKICLVSDLPIHLQYQKKFKNIITFKTNSPSSLKYKLLQSIKKPITSKTNTNSDWKKTAQIYLNIFKKL